MFIAYICTALLGIAFLLQFAVDRAPDLHDSRDNKAARRVLIAGLFTLFCCMAYRCYAGYAGDALVPFSLTLIALAEIAFCMNRLFPEMGAAIERTMTHSQHPGTWQ